MKKGSTLLLKGVLAAIGLIVLALCVYVLPKGISTDAVGYYRPILLGMYVPAIPFFIALWQAYTLLGCIDKNNAFSDLSVKSIKNIKYCAFIISGLYAIGMPYIFYAAQRDDAPGVVLIGLVIVGASFVVAVFAAVLEKLVQNAIDIKSETGLTV
jgi:hypothetical protein